MNKSLVPVYQNLVKLDQTSSTNAKIDLLKKYLQDPLFLKVVKFALAGDLKFKIKSLFKFKSTLAPSSIDQLFAFLTRLSKQSGASDSDRATLTLLASIDSATYEVVKRIINKDLKCGVNAKTVNKARLGTINTVPYMRCSTDKKIDRIKYPAIIQEKADGMFVNVMINKKGQIKIITRNGKTVYQLRKLKNIIRLGEKDLTKKKNGKNVTIRSGILNSRFKNSHLGKVYTGELLVVKNGITLPRKTGNGILNQCLQNTAKQSDADCVVLRVWDCLPLKNFYEGYYEILYNTRIFETQHFVSDVNNKEFVDTVMTKRVNNYEEAHDFYAYIRKMGGEGAILCNCDGAWKDHVSPDKIKMKNISEAELEIIGWEYGKKGTKYELCMGAIQCQSKEGFLEVFVGSGFSDKEREADWDLAEGSIATIEFESTIQDKRNKNKYSLFLPRFSCVREDRDVADTIQEILER